MNQLYLSSFYSEAKDMSLRRNQLKGADNIKAVDMIRKDWAFIEQSGCTQAEYAERLQQLASIETKLNASHIQRICRDLERPWPNGRGGRKLSTSSDIRLLAECMRAVMKELNWPVPDALHQLCKDPEVDYFAEEAE